MPDPVLMLEAMGVAAVAAALVFLLFGNAGASRPALAACGWVLGLGLGSWLGCLVLGLRPRWPLTEDLDRLLALVFPAFLGVELIASILRWPPAPRWLARGLVSTLAAPALLYGSSYLSDVAGPGTREWSPASAVLILGVQALALIGEWFLVEAAAGRGSTGSMVLALALSTGGAAVALLLSGYASGGQMGLPLAAALAGLALATMLVPEQSRPAVSAGVGLVGLYSLLVIGRFFASLTTAHAILLFLAPLVGSAVVLLLPRPVGPRVRFTVSLLSVVVLVGGVLASAGARFAAANGSPTRTAGSSLEDYSKLAPTPATPRTPETSPWPSEPSPDALDPVSP